MSAVFFSGHGVLKRLSQQDFRLLHIMFLPRRTKVHLPEAIMKLHHIGKDSPANNNYCSLMNQSINTDYYCQRQTLRTYIACKRSRDKRKKLRPTTKTRTKRIPYSRVTDVQIEILW